MLRDHRLIEKVKLCTILGNTILALSLQITKKAEGEEPFAKSRRSSVMGSFYFTCLRVLASVGPASSCSRSDLQSPFLNHFARRKPKA